MIEISWMTFLRLTSPVEMFQTKMDRKSFLDIILGKPSGAIITRSDSQILTLSKKDGDWFAVIAEKLEYERKAADGKSMKLCNLWITRDGWRQIDGKWKLISNVALSSEAWPSKSPVRDGKAHQSSKTAIRGW